AGDREGRASPRDAAHIGAALRGELVAGSPSTGEATGIVPLMLGHVDEFGRQVLIEADWLVTRDRLIGELTAGRWPDLDRVVWGLRERLGTPLIPLQAGGRESEMVAEDVPIASGVIWRLEVAPKASWSGSEAGLRRALWIVGGLAMALSVGFLLAIEIKNKTLVRLANSSIEAAALVETILDGSEDYSILATDLSGIIIRANRGTGRLFGHPPPRILGQSITIFGHPQAPASDRLDHILRVTLDSGRYDDVVVMRRADGTMLHVQMACAVRTDARGAPIGFVVITHDVTALLDRTVRLEQLNAQLAEQTRVAKRANRLINEFLANMSHELRTPLNAILGYTRLVQRKTAGLIPDKQADNLQRIHDSGSSLLRLINDLLDLSKIEAGRMPIQCEPVNVAAIAAEVVETVRPLAESQHDRIDLDVAPGLGPIVSDPHHLRQIVMNLTANAIKFTSKGLITVSLRPGRDPDMVQIEVRDTGIGIPEEQLPHIFEAFFQVDGSATRAHGGTGLGLSIVQRLAQRLGGKVTVDSQLGQGSIFTVTLPRDVTAAPQPVVTEPAGEAR
ncbi:MAG: PAS domain S-box protein, partial [Candidatus Sumerlaeia bacterium]|nr:PAS domain S-box protein [Candidatus Sumerlaeia bacterium]